MTVLDSRWALKFGVLLGDHAELGCTCDESRTIIGAIP